MNLASFRTASREEVPAGAKLNAIRGLLAREASGRDVPGEEEGEGEKRWAEEAQKEKRIRGEKCLIYKSQPISVSLH